MKTQKGLNPIPTILATAAALAVVFGSANVRAEEGADVPKKLRVVTSFLPIQSHAAAIAGESAIVEQLLDKDSGPHDFQLTPAAVRKLADADLFIINGAGMEDWLQELTQKAGNKNLVVVDTSKGVRLLDNPDEIEAGNSSDHDHDHGDDHAHNHDHAHEGGKNPHIWLDPVIALKQAKSIANALQKADPANASTYNKNAEAYMAELKKLDQDFRSTLGSLPNKKLVTFHEAFPYLAKRYGLTYVGAISEFPEKDPSPKQLAALVDKIKELQVGVLFSEKDYAPDLLDKIALESGAKVSSLDTLEVGEGSSSSYIQRMRANLASLKTAFTSQP